jgi:hypothetical protein
LTFLDGIKINNKNMNEATCCRDGIYKISAASLAALRRQQRRQPKTGIEIFAASMADIDKALAPKTRTDP